MLTEAQKAKLLKLRDWIDYLITAQEVLAETYPEPAEAPDPKAWNASKRNRVLAGSGDKAALMGTLSTEPTVAKSDITDCGLTSKTAGELIAARNKLRAQALDIDPESSIPAAIEKDKKVE